MIYSRFTQLQISRFARVLKQKKTISPTKNESARCCVYSFTFPISSGKQRLSKVSQFFVRSDQQAVHGEFAVTFRRKILLDFLFCEARMRLWHSWRRRRAVFVASRHGIRAAIAAVVCVLLLITASSVYPRRSRIPCASSTMCS